MDSGPLQAWLQVHGPKRFLREALHSVEGEAVELCFPPFVFRASDGRSDRRGSRGYERKKETVVFCALGGAFFRCSF